MTHQRQTKQKLGDVNPSQLLYAFGVGAIIELPSISAMVMGLDDWPIHDHVREISENRLLEAIQLEVGQQVQRMLMPPVALKASGLSPDPLSREANVGVPVAPFPRWMVCPRCRLLAPLGSELFALKTDPYRLDRNRYVHTNCTKGKEPTVVPARFLVACEAGHLDDFPWVEFVHRGPTDCRYRLRLYELGASGEAADIQVECETCGATRRMSDAFSEPGKQELSTCTARWPHLRIYSDSPCDREARAILLGASNSWFPLQMSALFVPSPGGALTRLVEENWATLGALESLQNVELLRRIGQLNGFGEYSDGQIWEAVEAFRSEAEAGASGCTSLKEPEWQVFSNPDPSLNGRDFYLRQVDPPPTYSEYIDKVVLVERLRQVSALIGFSRIESPGQLGEEDEFPQDQRAPLCRGLPSWVPANEVRGEGLFIQFSEEAIQSWLERTIDLNEELFDAHCKWRLARNFDEPAASYPAMRYVLLHSFAHAMIRQLALECGYTSASIRERLYSQDADDGQEPMAGVLLYTAAPDSEGTLGGLVGLGKPDTLDYHIAQALEGIRLCASDPLCAEHRADRDPLTIHGAACHACLFAPETSCERGNKYLDRSVLVRTVDRTEYAFFGD